MFNWFKKEKPRQFTIRDTLFGDMPLSEWAKDDNVSAEPWVTFVKAKKLLEKKDTSSAAAMLQKITEMPGLESRHYLQAWHILRQIGVNPPADKAKLVHGVVVEVAVNGGADIVAAYTDYTARYLHHTGSGVVWEHPNDSLDPKIKGLLEAGQAVANRIGPWEQERPPAPQGDNVRLNMLTPSGLHFGYGSYQTLHGEPMGRAILDPATALLMSLTELGKKK